MSRFNRHSTAEEVAEIFSAQITGKNVLVTGVTLGSVGFESARVIAKHAALVVLAGRNQDKLNETKNRIIADHPTANLRTLVLDLSSFAAVRKAASEVISYPEPINVLINNAAVFSRSYQKTVDGYELQLQTNHLGPFLFTALIYARIVAGGTKESPARIINISSSAHQAGPFRLDDPNFDNSGGKEYNKFVAYGSTKAANIQFANEIVKRTQAKGVPILAFSVHPGVVETSLGNDVDLEDWISFGVKNEKGEWTTSELKTLGEGASGYIVAAFDPDLAKHNGGYLIDSNIADAAPHVADQEAAEKLWKFSEEAVHQPFVI